MQRGIGAAVVLALISIVCSAQKKEEAQKTLHSVDELQQQIEKILKDTKTPGVSVAIVNRDGPEWVAGIGTSDVASARAATSDTLFRIGSVSKGFASLAVLMLAEQGRLSLDDPVRKLAPEVWFENRWETTDPVRVVHLLEHTTGWDDIHFREYAKQVAPTMGLREALDYDHHSRISRWRPGTRMAYCNAGPAVAAYIVEKLTGQRFEDFIEEHLFRPIGMKTATYLPPAPGTAATLYHADGKTPYPYWNIIFRPAGSINASATDMAAYVQFYLNRGKANGVQIVPAADIARMESPASTWAAQAGLKTGYGLSNYWEVDEGFVYHGHDGGVEGGLTEMHYMADYGTGYFYSINSGSGDALERVGKAIRNYITRDLQKPAQPPVAPLSQDAAEFTGWYEMDSPRQELTHFADNLGGIAYVSIAGDKLFFTSLGAWKVPFVPVVGALFRSLNKRDPPEPVPTLALMTPKEGGRYLAIRLGTQTMKQIPAWLATLEIVVTVLVLFAMVTIVVYAPFWLLAGLSKKRRRPAERSMRIWPLAAVLSLFAIVAIFSWGPDDVSALGNLTVWSASICVATIAFALASIGSAAAAWRARNRAMRPWFRRYSLVVTAALLIAVAYLARWGVIGVRTWA